MREYVWGSGAGGSSLAAITAASFSVTCGGNGVWTMKLNGLLPPPACGHVLHWGATCAAIDCRLLPGQTKDDWIRQVKERIGDERIEVSLYSPDHGEPQPVPWDTELFRTIHAVVSEAMEDAVVVPTMTIGGTDNRFLRDRGIPAYGFIPCLLSPEERAGFHGNNEFMTIDNLQMGCELMYEIVRRMVT